MGLSDAAEILGWDRRRVQTYISRGAFPEPIQRISNGPIWTREQIENYRVEREITVKLKYLKDNERDLAFSISDVYLIGLGKLAGIKQVSRYDGGTDILLNAAQAISTNFYDIEIDIDTHKETATVKYVDDKHDYEMTDRKVEYTIHTEKSEFGPVYFVTLVIR